MTTQELQSIRNERLRPAVRDLWLKFYPDYDGSAFEHHIAMLVQPDMKVLEIGAGSGQGHQHVFALKGRCAFYVGIDLDDRVRDNPHLDEARIADAASIPFENETFDLVFHKMVAEHLADPLAALKEAARVLKPGGLLVFETPSRLYYPMLIARWTPTWLHRLFVRHFASGRTDDEVFPTHYRLNVKRTIESLCKVAGLDPRVSFRSTPPGYLRSSVPLFLLGVLYERLIEHLVPNLRALIWVDARKVGDDARRATGLVSDRI